MLGQVASLRSTIAFKEGSGCTTINVLHGVRRRERFIGLYLYHKDDALFLITLDEIS